MSNFSWYNFDADFLKAVLNAPETPEELHVPATIEYKEFLIPSMNVLCTYPDMDFVRSYRTQIEFRLMSRYPEKVLEIGKLMKIDSRNHLSVINELSKKTLTKSLAQAYAVMLGNIGGTDYANVFENRFSGITDIDISKCILDDIPMYDFQMNAVTALCKDLITEDNCSGMLVMPTGSGKTRTAAYFLLKHMVSNGYQVVWLTHRYMLIDQTAEAFYNMCPLVKAENPDFGNFRLTCVSGMHSSSHALSKKDNVMILSIQSVCRNIDFLRAALAKKVIIVVDEAHHTTARSYQNVITAIRKKRKGAKLLGLTATPVRFTEAGTAMLNSIYERISYSISLSDLIAQNVLARPIAYRIKTNESFEPIISIDESAYIRKYGELPETLVAKIAQSSSRNQLIADTYMNEREKYGKTLIFAMNIPHCITLCETLRKRGVRCDYIFSGKENNAAVIRAFKNGLLDVLINVNIMTEGSDVPDINTVFLTRPTQSEGLLLQMIGRGMRGKNAGGTDTLNIVDFYDLWETFDKWLNIEWLVSTIAAEDDTTEPASRKAELVTYPAQLYVDIYNSIRYQSVRSSQLVTVPAAWYTLVDENGMDYRIIVYADQISGYDKMISEMDIPDVISAQTAAKLIRRYFRNFVSAPKIRDIVLLLENLRDNDEPPYRYTFEERDAISPDIVSSYIKEHSCDILEYPAEIYEKHPVVKELFGSLENYRQCIFDYLNNAGGKHRSHMVIEEIPYEKIPFDTTPVHDLEMLVREVKDEMFGGEYDGISSIEWTERPMSSYFGVYYYSDDHIEINSILNSPMVDRETVKYVIYHEMLHRDIRCHNKLFRQKEHLFPNYVKHDHFLDSEFLMFDIKER